MDKLRWIIPRPPSRARAIASLPSVTVSIAALMIGMLMVIVRVKRVCVETSRGSTDEAAGTMRTSSKVSPSPANLLSKAPGLCAEDMMAASSFQYIPATTLPLPLTQSRNDAGASSFRSSRLQRTLPEGQVIVYSSSQQG